MAKATKKVSNETTEALRRLADSAVVDLTRCRELYARQKAELENMRELLSRTNSEIEESVITKIRQRRERGRAKYQTTMERTDLTRVQWLTHAQEEALDLAIYLERIIRDEIACTQRTRKQTGKRRN